MRAVRVDKMTLAAFEATLRYYLDEGVAKEKIPTVSVLLQNSEKIRVRAKKIARMLQVALGEDGRQVAGVNVLEDVSQSGGGALAEVPFRTFTVSIVPFAISTNDLESRLRLGNPHVIARIKDAALVLDARTVKNEEIGPLVQAIKAALI